MATITVRDLPDGVREALKARARLHGRSMEAEAREVLAAAVADVFHPPEQIDVDPSVWDTATALVEPKAPGRAGLSRLKRHKLQSADSIDDLVEWAKGEH